MSSGGDTSAEVPVEGVTAGSAGFAGVRPTPAPGAPPDTASGDPPGETPADSRDAGEPCPHCGAPIDGTYCPHCGEMRASARSYSLREFAAEAFETVTDADSRVWATVTLLFGRPGELTVAYMAGDRSAYVRPLQLFLFANVFYFVMASWLGMTSFQTPLAVHVFRTAHAPVALELVRERLADPAIRQREYVQAFDARAAVQAKTLIIAMVPIWALLLALVQLRRREPATKHLVFTMHFFAALLVLLVAQELAILRPIVAVAMRSGVALTNMDGVVTLISATIMTGYLAVALRVAYGEGRVAAAIKGLVLALGFYLALFLYRAMLFFTVYWSI